MNSQPGDAAQELAMFLLCSPLSTKTTLQIQGTNLLPAGLSCSTKMAQEHWLHELGCGVEGFQDRQSGTDQILSQPTPRKWARARASEHERERVCLCVFVYVSVCVCVFDGILLALILREITGTWTEA